MKLSKVLFLAVLGLFTLSSCGDDDDSPKDLLTGGTWNLTESLSDDDGDGVLESDLDDCDADDTIDYNDDGTFTIDEGATKCDESDPQTTTGTWELSADGKVLTMDEDGVGLPFNVETLTSSRLELSINFFGETRVVYTR